MIRILSITILSIVAGFVAYGQTAVVQTDSSPEIGIGIEERLGEVVPLHLGFLDAAGDSVYLRDVVDRPTIVTLVYYHCPSICKPLLFSVVEVVDKTDLVPGEDYRILTISFDDRDTPESAADIKKNFTNSLEQHAVTDGWEFLVGDSVTIARLTEAVGFRFKRQDKDFAHTTSLIVLSPKGKVVRYLYGKRFMPFDLKMAVAEANEGRAVPSIARVLQYCFSYDPKGRRYALNLTRVAGTGILLFAVGWVLYLTSVGRKRGKVRG